MTDNGSTYWTMIEAAARGSDRDREAFANTYMPIIRAYLLRRWKGTRHLVAVDDATQEVFLECFREDGPLARADRQHPSGFRAFLFGVSRNVARRFETQCMNNRVASLGDSDVLDAIPSLDPSASIQFDRVWAQAMMVRAVAIQKARAEKLGEDAVRRVELLRMRFQEGQAIRDIARSWNIDAAKLHHEYAKARDEFKAALFDIVHRHGVGNEADARRECMTLLEILG